MDHTSANCPHFDKTCRTTKHERWLALRFWSAKCNGNRWIGAAIVPTKGADENAVAELKNDVTCSGITKVLIRSDNEKAILALKESTATALKLAGASDKGEENAMYDDSQSNGLAESAVKDTKDAVRTNLA